MAPKYCGNSSSPRGRRDSLCNSSEGAPVERHAVSINGHDVKANLGIWSNDLYVIGCEPANRLPFTRIYRRKRLAESSCGTGLDLDEHDCIAVAADEVDFAAGQPKILSDYTVSGGLKKKSGALFARAAFAAVS
jgi:hypothetical protein